MRKWPAILAIVLASFGGTPPIPGQTANHGSQSSHNPKDQAANGKNPDKPTAALIEKNCNSDQFKSDSDCKKAENNETAVSVSKLPTANISIQSNAKRDFLDWVSFWVSFALAMAGFGGVAVGVFTVLYIKRQTFEMAYQRLLMRRSLRAMRQQANLMGRQTEILDKSVATSQASADAAKDQIQMLKAKERARIQVTPVDFDTVDLDENKNNHMVIEFLNLGPTYAFNVKAEGDGWFTVKGFDPPEIEITDLVLPAVLRPNIPETAWVPLVFDGKAGDEVRDMWAKTLIEMMGSVEYEDVFGEAHKTAFHYRMFVYGWAKSIAPNMPTKMKRMGGWSKAGPAEDNHAS